VAEQAELVLDDGLLIYSERVRASTSRNIRTMARILRLLSGFAPGELG
jgi:hypothetical protein